MKTLVLRLDVDGDLRHPMHEFVATHSAYGPTRLLQWNPQGFEANVLLFYVDGPREPFADALAEVPTAETVQPAETAGTEGFYLFVKERLDGGDRQLVESFAEEDVVIVPPIVYDTDGSIRLTVVGESAALQRSTDRTPDSVGVSVVEIHSGAVGADAAAGGLTDRQREALAEALAAGYYEDPRAATVSDVGARLGCAPSTAAEHLRKAESALVRRALETP